MSRTSTLTERQELPLGEVVFSRSTSGVTNQAFVLQEKGRFSYETHRIPTLASDRHVIVMIKATGLCGSDIHYWQHGEIGQFKVRKPLVLGHESVDTVWQCGSAVTSVRPGDNIAIELGIPCRVCSFCKEGRYNLCPEVEFAATPPFDGTLQTYYCVPEDFCYKLPTSVSIEEGALLEPLSVALHCAKLANISFGVSVLVLGAGPIGLLCCAVARAFGTSSVVAVDIVQARLDFARQYAATEVYLVGGQRAEEDAENIRKVSGRSDGFDIVIDATGAQKCIATGIHALKTGGKFVQAGLGAPEITFPIAQLCAKEGSFIGSFRYGANDYSTALGLLQSGKVSLKELITHRYGFNEAEAAFRNVAQRQGIKTVIRGPDVP